MPKAKSAHYLCWPVSQWPSLDRMAWAAAFEPADPFGPTKPAARWSAASRRKTASGYGRYLAWLDARCELKPSMSIAERISRERLASYLQELKKLNKGHTLHNRIQELGDALRVLAPTQDWGWISRAAGRLRGNTEPARDKRARLRPVDELIAAGLVIMEQAESTPGFSPRRRALQFRDGLMVAFLGFNPIRRSNIADLRLGVSLILGKDCAFLNIVADETKGPQPHEGELAGILLPGLQRFLGHHRAVLLSMRPTGTPATDFLWVSAQGTPLSEQMIYRRVIKATARSGNAISPHLFRSCAATTVAVRAPAAIDIVPALLGHSSPEISEQYYNLAGSLEASRAHNAVVAKLLRKPRAKRPDR